MKTRTTLIAVLPLILVNFATAQNSLLENIPTQEFSIVTFNGKSIGEKSKNAKDLAIFDTLDVQFNSFLTEYKQYLLDENSEVTEEGVEEVIELVEEEAEDATIYNYEKSYYDDDYYKVKPKLDLEQLFPSLANRGSKYGVNHLANYYFVIGMSDTINHSALVFEKNSEEKFNSFIGQIVPQEHTDKYIRLTNGYQYFHNEDNNLLIAWNNKVAAFIEYLIPYDWNYSEVIETTTDEEYYESYEDRLKADAKKKEDAKIAKIEALINQFFVSKPELSLKYNTTYQKTQLRKSDVSYYINNSLTKNNPSFSTIFKSSAQSSNEFLNLFKDNYGYGYLDFDPSSINLSSIQHVGSAHLKKIKEINKIKFSKSMYKYRWRKLTSYSWFCRKR